MKIAFVANTGWNIYNFRKGLVQYFLEVGHEVLVLTPRDAYVPVLEEWGVKWIETPLDATGNSPLKDLAYLKCLYFSFKKERPDVVLGYTIKSNIYSCLVAAILRTPVICNVSGLGTVFLVQGLMGKVAMGLYKIAFKYAAFVFFQNEDDQSLFLSKINVARTKVDVLPGSGINLEEFQPREYEPSNTFRFLMVSRLIIEKGVQDFADAAARFANNKNVAFTLVGKLDESHARSIVKSDLKNWMESGWLTYLPHSDKVEELITEHDAVILPSYREGTPRTLLEGAALGRALIASQVPGCIEVVEDGVNGFLFEVKNSESLVSKLKLFMSLSFEERVEMMNNSRRLVEERFDEKFVIEAYKSVISRITGYSFI